MRIRAGYDIAFTVTQPTPMILMLTVHPSRAKDLLTEENLVTTPRMPLRHYRDAFDNVCTRIIAPSGLVEFKAVFEISDSGNPDEVVPAARQHPIEELPDDVLVYLLGSRYCDTQRLLEFAWHKFGTSRPGWVRVQAICDFVHHHIKFGYQDARDDRTASDAYREQVASRHHSVSLHEHSRPLLHRLPRRHRCTAGPCADGFQRLVRGFSRWPVVYIRCPTQPPSHRPYSHSLRTRCVGCSDLDKLWSGQAGALQGGNGRGHFRERLLR
jgi:hypothetical protein